MILQTEIAHQKKIFPLKTYRQIYLVDDNVTYQWIHTVGKIIGECLEYRSKISVFTFVDHCGRYCQMPMD